MENNYFTRSFIKPVIQSWLSTLSFVKDSSKKNRMFIEFITDNTNDCSPLANIGIIQFYDKSIEKREAGEFYGDLMELSVYKNVPTLCSATLSEYLTSSSKNPDFYLHFEMHDFEFVMEQLSSFFHFIYNTKSTHNQDFSIPEDSDYIHSILICCTAGLTSGYFAAMLQSRIDEQCPDCRIEVNSCNVDFLQDYVDDYELVLLTPQVAFKEKELQEKYGEKIQLMDKLTFATFNIESLLDQIYKR
ncbi:MAG: hypothetical protein KBT48_09005 [Firmicutes bacterium]|nr:hypothetical protein [Bacillota bacterium]